MAKLRLRYPLFPRWAGPFIEQVADRLDMRDMNAQIRFFFVPEIEEDKRILGKCYAEKQNLCDIYIAHSAFSRKDSRELKLNTIAHEMVHAHQFLSGRLGVNYMNRGWCWMWQGARYSDIDRTDEDLPWEREAYLMENVLYNEIIGA